MLARYHLLRSPWSQNCSEGKGGAKKYMKIQGMILDYDSWYTEDIETNFQIQFHSKATQPAVRRWDVSQDEGLSDQNTCQNIIIMHVEEQLYGVGQVHRRSTPLHACTRLYDKSPTLLQLQIRVFLQHAQIPSQRTTTEVLTRGGSSISSGALDHQWSESQRLHTIPHGVATSQRTPAHGQRGAIVWRQSSEDASRPHGRNPQKTRSDWNTPRAEQGNGGAKGWDVAIDTINQKEKK